MEGAKHIPVLLKETIDALAVKSGGRYIDGTFGRGGHSRAIAALGGDVLGIDRDDDAIAAAGDFKVVKGCHGDIERIAHENKWDGVDGILLDLGVSSPQLDEAERGFSFLREGPLDMRMDRSQGVSAAELVNNESVENLTAIFRELGEEPQARRIAQALVRARDTKRIVTTADLAGIVEHAVGRHTAHHPATKVFQALRMAVNDEVGELKRALEQGLGLLNGAGRFAVITFESITDRIVKRFFAAHAGRMVSLQGGGEQWEGELPKVRAVFKKVVTATEEEVNLNPRSRSAKLRVVEKESN
jgi:16S rRNA (cytosine1402-N4)-methyltransferase